MDTSEDAIELLLLVASCTIVMSSDLSLLRLEQYSVPGVGDSYIKDLLTCRHPERVRSALRMDVRVFKLLFQAITDNIKSGRSLSILEKMAIGLDWLGQGITMRNQCEKFRRSPSTIKLAREEFVNAVVLSLGYTMTVGGWSLRAKTNLCIPHDDDFHYHFRGAVGSIDGSHFRLTVPEEESDTFRNRKGWTSTNVQIVCDHVGRIVHVYPGCEGCAHDGWVLRHSMFMHRFMDSLPPNTYLLGDAGYPLIKGRLLVPYRGVRYHLQEFSTNPPKNKRELFNLRHSRLRTTVERVIGILKRRWRVFRVDNSINKHMHSKSILACSLLHNFIHDHDVTPDEDSSFEDDDEDSSSEDIELNLDCEFDGRSEEGAHAYDEARAWRDSIADEMWETYVYHATH